ncbi:hypothetical protein ACFS5L_44505 [Streptomyces phyllanthi]|uniref:DUF3558 domain-containing protein n=1 Tax=Streptomyces phyllanthi TaxID=1803180 RepID=A0A5N8W2F8_9ACTN|nr:hypothetical protein [Streptomyces phyllanthi]MPY40494.1 hypothetical protein [Streptomyces phyllanthi]
MYYRRTALLRPVGLAIAAVTALVAATSGCSGDKEEREYAVPSALCGMAVDAEDLTPFLPAGRKITVRDKSSTGIESCEVVVDDTLILTTTQAWLEQGRTTAYFASGQTLNALDHSAEEGRFRYSGNEAFGKAQGCTDTKDKQELYTAIQAQGSKHRDADAMKRLIASYTKEVESSAECTAGAP